MVYNKEYMQEYYQANKDQFKARNKATRERKQAFIKEYKNRPCMDCNVWYPHYVMDLDHRPGTEKLYQPADMPRLCSWKQMAEELAKCDIVCSNCHRERTFSREQYLGF